MMFLRTISKARIAAPLTGFWAWSLVGILILFDLPPLKIIDFMNVWAGSKLVMAGKIDVLYSIGDYRRYMCALLGPQCFDVSQIQKEFSYPPHILLFVLAFGLPAAAVSLALWDIAGITSLLAALRANRFRKADWRLLALVASCPACVLTAVGGQNGAFTAALFLGGFYLCETAPVAAGVLFGVLTVKPHLGVLIPLALLLRRNWACIGSAAVTVGALFGTSVALWGLQPWIDYVTKQLPFQADYLTPTAQLVGYQIWMPGPYADAAFVIGLRGAGAWALYAAAACYALFEVFSGLRREAVTARTVLMLALGTLLVLPYASAYDMTMIMGAIAVYLSTQKDLRLPEYLLCGAVWTLPIMIVPLRHLHLPVSSLLLLALLGCLGQRSRQEALPAAPVAIAS